MAIATTCPNCKARFRLDDELVGKKVKCQGCASVFVVPSAAEAAAEPWSVASPKKEAALPPEADAPPPADPDATGIVPPKVTVPPPHEDDDEDEKDEEERSAKKRSSGPPPMSKSGASRRERRERPEAGSSVTMIAVLVVLLGVGLLSCLACVIVGGYWIFAVGAPGKPGPIAAADKQAKPNPPDEQKKDDGVKPPPPPVNFPPGGINAALGFDGTFRSDNVLNGFDPIDPRYNKRRKVYMLHMTAGDWYQIDMISNQMDSYLILYNDLAQEVARDDDSGGFPHARILYRADRSGVYRIHATQFGGGGGGGNYMLFVRRTINGQFVMPPDPNR